MTIEGHADLDAAERALRDAYQQIRERVSIYATRSVKTAVETPTIVHIMPRGRRVESGWYKMAAWADKTDRVIEGLDFDEHTPTPNRDEVFIAGEALAGSPRQIVDLLFHQFVHQVSRQESGSTYHGREFMQTAHALGVWDVERHSTQGWVEFTQMSLDTEEVLADVAASLDRSAFDLYRHPEATKTGSGKMKLWTCKCKRGARVYTGAILHAYCEKCGYKFLYAHKDRYEMAIIHRIESAGEEVAEG